MSSAVGTSALAFSSTAAHMAVAASSEFGPFAAWLASSTARTASPTAAHLVVNAVADFDPAMAKLATGDSAEKPSIWRAASQRILRQKQLSQVGCKKIYAFVLGLRFCLQNL